MKADSLEDLAKEMGVPEEAFAKTMAEYNQGAKEGKDALGKKRTT